MTRSVAGGRVGARVAAVLRSVCMAALVAGGAHGQAREDASRPPLQDEGGASRPAPVVEPPEELRWVLDEVAALEAAGDLETARGLLGEVVEGELYTGLLGEEPEVVLAGLAAIDGAAEPLGLLTIQAQVRGERHERLSASLHADDSRVLAAEQALGITRARLGDLAGALELFEHVHAARARLLPAEHPHLLAAKANLAGARSALGDLAGALELTEHVHAAWERLLPAEHPDLLAAKLNLALMREASGDLAGALGLQEQVHAIRERLLPADHPDLLVAKGNLAATRRELGDLAGALELSEQVHAARERILPAGHPDLLVAEQNLAALRYELGDRAGALELQEEVHAAWERLLPDDHPHVLASKQNLAVTRKALGDDAGALELQEQVHATRERLLPAEHPDLLSAKENLALTRRSLGDLAGALELEETVLAVRERLLPTDHPDVLRTKKSLAATRYGLGDLPGAIELTRSLLESQLARAAGLRTESPRVARAAAVAELSRLSSALLVARSAEAGTDDDPDGEADPIEPQLFAVLESLRLVSTSSAELALAAAGAPELRQRRDSLSEVRAELNDLGLSPPAEPGGLETWRRRLVELADERDALERGLRRALEERGVLTALPTSEAVAEGLAEEAALVSFFRYASRLGPDRGAGPRSVDSLLAFVVRADATVERVELGPSAELAELATEWRALLGKPIERGVGVVRSETSEEEVGRELRERLLDPCLAALGEQRPSTLHLILDDFLHLVPVDALPWSEGERVGEVLDVRVEVSARRLMAPARDVPRAGTLLALGGVDFDAKGVVITEPAIPLARPPSPDRSSARREFSPLIQSRFEVEAVGALYEMLASGEPVVLLEDAASKRALAEHASGARWLHVATHGWFAPESIASLYDSPGADGGGELEADLARAEDTVRGFAPETLCGLALAGANRGTDGLLTAEELATLDLSGCELAILSACETSVGLRRAGQGIQSLQAALHAAGARTAITSLWRVDDAATRRLMELFYTRLWRDGLGKAEALWRAKTALRDEGHPLRDWAGWVLTGDPD